MSRIWMTTLLVACGGSLTPLVVDDATVDPDAFPSVDTGTPDTTEPPLDTVDTGTPAPPPTPVWTCPDGPFPGTSSTAGQGDDGSGSCGGASGSDVHLSFVAPSTGRYLFDLDGTSFDSVLYVLDGCGGPELACQDTPAPEQILVDLVAGQQAIVVVDGVPGAEGAYAITATPVPYTETVCDDGVDDDLDGPRDCADSDCVGHPACAEVCTDGIDNDLDGLVDCLDTADCGSRAACASPCADDVAQPPFPITLTGNTDAATDDFSPSCTTSNAPDLAIEFIAPATGVYRFETLGSSFDTALYALGGCAGAELDCNDDHGGGLTSRIELSMTIGQRVIIVVDGWRTSSGAMQLTVDH